MYLEERQTPLAASGAHLAAAALSVILSTYYAPGTAKSGHCLFARLGIRLMKSIFQILERRL